MGKLLLAILFAGLAVCHATTSYGNSNSNADSAATNFNIALAGTTTGSSIIVTCSTSYTSVGLCDIPTDSAGNTYSQVATVNVGGNATQSHYLTTNIGAGGALSITMNFTALANGYGAATEYTTDTVPLQVDGTPGTGGFGTGGPINDITCGTVTAHTTSGVIVATSGFQSFGGTDSISGSTGFTVRQSSTSTTIGTGGSTMDKIISASGSISPVVSNTNGMYVASCIAVVYSEGAPPASATVVPKGVLSY